MADPEPAEKDNHLYSLAELPPLPKRRDVCLEEVALLRARGCTASEIAKRLGATTHTISRRLETPEVVGMVLELRKEFLDKAKQLVVRNMQAALERLPRYFDLNGFHDEATDCELDAIQFAIEKGLAFTRCDADQLRVDNLIQDKERGLQDFLASLPPDMRLQVVQRETAIQLSGNGNGRRVIEADGDDPAA